MNSVKLSYYAGIFDGEGCISISKNKAKFKDGRNRLHVRVAIAMTESGALTIMANDFGGHFKLRKAKDNNAACWTWTLCSKKAINFLKAIKPYCIVKSSQIDLALEFNKNIGIFRNGPNYSMPQSEINRRYDIRNSLIKSHRGATRVHTAKVANSANPVMATPSQAESDTLTLGRV